MSESIKHLSLLGFKVIDKVTGFKGVVSSMTYDLYGCIQAIVQPFADGSKIEDCRYFDVTRLQVTSDEPVMTPPNFEKGYVAEGKKGPAEKPVQ
jgi:hypothetical protein